VNFCGFLYYSYILTCNSACLGVPVSQNRNRSRQIGIGSHPIHMAITMEEDQVLPVLETLNWAPFMCLFSIGFFYTSNKAFLSHIVPSKPISQGPESVWKFKNVANSFIHSTITGFGSLLCLYLYPNMAENVITTYSTMALALSAFTSGYFLFDFADMYRNYRKSSTYELLVHHALTVSCFAVSSLSRYYLGFAVIGLLIEVNSVFLHWRGLLLMSGTKKSHLYFRMISLLNLATFIVFRIFVIGWMIKWLSRNRETISLATYILGNSCLCTVLVMSITLFFRLLRSDYYKSGGTPRVTTNNNQKGHAGEDIVAQALGVTQ